MARLFVRRCDGLDSLLPRQVNVPEVLRRSMKFVYISLGLSATIYVFLVASTIYSLDLSQPGRDTQGLGIVIWLGWIPATLIGFAGGLALKLLVMLVGMWSPRS